jgi:hypothetical protein
VPSLEATNRQAWYVSFQTVGNAVNCVSVGPLSFDTTNLSVTDISADGDRNAHRATPVPVDESLVRKHSICPPFSVLSSCERTHSVV